MQTSGYSIYDKIYKYIIQTTSESEVQITHYILVGSTFLLNLYFWDMNDNILILKFKLRFLCGTTYKNADRKIPSIHIYISYRRRNVV